MSDAIYYHQQYSVIHALLKQMSNLQREITFRLEEMETLMDGVPADVLEGLYAAADATKYCTCDECWGVASDYRMD